MEIHDGISVEHAYDKAQPDASATGALRPQEVGMFPYIPKAQQQRSGLLVDFFSLPGASGSIDHIDLLMLGEKRFGVLLANVPAAVHESIEDLEVLRSAIRDQNPSSSAAVTLRALHRFFGENLKVPAAILAFYAIFNQQKRSINFASAGHEPMIIYRPNSDILFRVNCEGHELGSAVRGYDSVEDMGRARLKTMRSESIKIRQHDLVLLYSDGLLAVKNNWGEKYGLARFLEFIRRNGNKQPSTFLAELQNELEEFSMGEPLQRDATVIAVKNMLRDTERILDSDILDVQDRFLTFEEEKRLWQESEKHPDARIHELIEILGGRFVLLGTERIRFYLATGHRFPVNGGTEIPKAKKRFDSVEKLFQREMLQAFPIRQLLYRKYEFRGNTDAIQKALHFYEEGKFQEALVEFTKVRRAIAESEPVNCFFGNLYLLLNMSIKARQEFLKALKLNPRSVNAHLALSYISLLHEDYEGTINSLNTAIRLDSNLQNYERFLNKLVRELDKRNGSEEWIS